MLVTNNEIETFYVNVKRTPKKMGYRGSTRPHFYYQTNKSMATLHTQDGSKLQNMVNIYLTNNKDKNFIFFINPTEKKATVSSELLGIYKGSVKKKTKLREFIIEAKGSSLLEIKKENKMLENNFFKCNSSVPIKCYYIIADKKLEQISVDHL